MLCCYIQTLSMHTVTVIRYLSYDSSYIKLCVCITSFSATYTVCISNCMHVTAYNIIAIGI